MDFSCGKWHACADLTLLVGTLQPYQRFLLRTHPYWGHATTTTTTFSFV